MAQILDRAESPAPEAGPVRCPICGHGNTPGDLCRHVRWTFDQGDPLDFAFFALETSPYTSRGGHRTRDIPREWWTEHGDFIVDLVLLHFDASDGYVFGEIVHLDLLARDVWNEFAPQAQRSGMPRV